MIVRERDVDDGGVDRDDRRAEDRRQERSLPAGHAGQSGTPTIGRHGAAAPHPRLDRLDRHPGARRRRAHRRPRGRRASAPAARGSRWSRRRSALGVRADRAGRPRRRGPRGGGLDRRRGAGRPRGARAADHRDPSADLVLNALVGSAGLGPTVAALGEGIDLALANKESLVVGGELVMQLAEATGARAASRSTPSTRRCTSCWPAERPGTRGAARSLTASGGPFRGRTRDELADVTVERGARAPDLGDGRQDHDRLGDADEQGPRGDRGPPPVRHALRRGSTSSCTRSRSSTRSSTLCDGATLAHLGLPGHARPDRLRAALPRARRRAGPRALDLAEVGA